MFVKQYSVVLRQYDFTQMVVNELVRPLIILYIHLQSLTVSSHTFIGYFTEVTSTFIPTSNFNHSRGLLKHLIGCTSSRRLFVDVPIECQSSPYRALDNLRPSVCDRSRHVELLSVSATRLAGASLHSPRTEVIQQPTYIRDGTSFPAGINASQS